MLFKIVFSLLIDQNSFLLMIFRIYLLKKFRSAFCRNFFFLDEETLLYDFICGLACSSSLLYRTASRIFLFCCIHDRICVQVSICLCVNIPAWEHKACICLRVWVNERESEGGMDPHYIANSCVSIADKIMFFTLVSWRRIHRLCFLLRSKTPVQIKKNATFQVDTCKIQYNHKR